MTKKVVGIIAAIILVAALVPNTLSAQIVRDTVYRQNFDTTWSTTTPPTNWTIIHTTTGGATDAVTSDDWDMATRSTGNYMAQLYYAYETGIDRLVSPQLDCSDSRYTSVYLRVYHQYDFWNYTYTAQIRGSDDNGSTYPNILIDYNNSDYGPILETFDISWALGQDDVRIDFYGSGYSYYINWWNVDDFMVYGEWNEGGGNDSTVDLQMAAILRPFDVEEAGVAFNPTCKIFSTSTTDTTPAEVRCRITRTDDMQVVYDKVLDDFPCYPGYTTCGAFSSFTPEGGKIYKVLFVVTYENDADPSNDNLEKRWSASVGEEVTPTEILVPADNQQNAFVPSAKFMEKAGIDEPGVLLHCRIEGLTPAAVYEDSVTHDFTADEEYTASNFPQVTGLESGTTYTITFWATNKSGGTISVPPTGLSKNFEYVGIVEKPVEELTYLTLSGNAVNFSLAKTTTVSLKVYDASGQVVSTLASGSMGAGFHTVTLNAEPGVYFVKLVTPDYSVVKKATILK